MKTLNSLSGGKTSSFMAVNFPTDYNVFALVTTNDKKLIFPDNSIRKIVSDKIGREFIGTLEENEIIYTMIDLEQMIGKPIDWVVGQTFDDIIKNKNGFFLPNVINRFCTYEMKIEPIKKFWNDNIKTPIETQIGFRANEMQRAKKMIERCENDGFIYEKFIVGKTKNGNKNRWQRLKYQKPKFPLIENNIFKDQIELFWKDKNVRFAKRNNCVGCFHRNEILLKHMSNTQSDKFDWFIEAEKKSMGSFKKGITYQQIKNHKTQLEFFDEDFNECDSGYCGL